MIKHEDYFISPPEALNSVLMEIKWFRSKPVQPLRPETRLPFMWLRNNEEV